jgi:hypothetical protein
LVIAPEPWLRSPAAVEENYLPITSPQPSSLELAGELGDHVEPSRRRRSVERPRQRRLDQVLIAQRLPDAGCVTSHLVVIRLVQPRKIQRGPRIAGWLVRFEIL